MKDRWIICHIVRICKVFLPCELVDVFLDSQIDWMIYRNVYTDKAILLYEFVDVFEGH